MLVARVFVEEVPARSFVLTMGQVRIRVSLCVYRTYDCCYSLKHTLHLLEHQQFTTTTRNLTAGREAPIRRCKYSDKLCVSVRTIIYQEARTHHRLVDSPRRHGH